MKSLICTVLSLIFTIQCIFAQQVLEYDAFSKVEPPDIFKYRSSLAKTSTSFINITYEPLQAGREMLSRPNNAECRNAI
jgi:hypothetical protein